MATRTQKAAMKAGAAAAASAKAAKKAAKSEKGQAKTEKAPAKPSGKTTKQSKSTPSAKKGAKGKAKKSGPVDFKEVPSPAQQSKASWGERFWHALGGKVKQAEEVAHQHKEERAAQRKIEREAEEAARAEALKMSKEEKKRHGAEERRKTAKSKREMLHIAKEEEARLKAEAHQAKLTTAREARAEAARLVREEEERKQQAHEAKLAAAREARAEKARLKREAEEQAARQKKEAEAQAKQAHEAKLAEAREARQAKLAAAREARAEAARVAAAAEETRKEQRRQRDAERRERAKAEKAEAAQVAHAKKEDAARLAQEKKAEAARLAAEEEERAEREREEKEAARLQAAEAERERKQAEREEKSRRDEEKARRDAEAERENLASEIAKATKASKEEKAKAAEKAPKTAATHHKALAADDPRTKMSSKSMDQADRLAEELASRRSKPIVIDAEDDAPAPTLPGVGRNRARREEEPAPQELVLTPAPPAKIADAAPRGLSLPESFILLALEEEWDERRERPQPGDLGGALAGAMLLELALRGRLLVQRDRLTLQGSPSDDAAVEAIAQALSPIQDVPSLKAMAEIAKAGPELLPAFKDRLKQRGFIDHAQWKHMGMFHRSQVKLLDTDAQERLQGKLRRAIAGGGTPDATTIMALGLLDAAGLFETVVPAGAVDYNRKRLNGLLAGRDVMGYAVDKELKAMQEIAVRTILANVRVMTVRG